MIGTLQKPVFGILPKISNPYGIPFPIGLWLMNEGSGNRVNDLSGNGNMGTLVADTHWVPGKFGSALSFDGGGDKIDMGSPELLKFAPADADFSIIAGIRRITTDDEYVIDFRDGGDDGWDLRFVSDSLWCQLDNADVKTSSTITDTDCHQVGVVIKRTGNGQMYIDGLADGVPVDVSGEGTMAITADMYIGGTDTGGANAFFTGDIEFIMIFLCAITPQQVAQLYVNPFPWFKRDPIELWAAAMTGAGPSGLSIPIAMHHYKQMAGVS